MKKILTFLVTVLVLVAAMTTVLASTYVGNANSKKFHFTDCSAANKIKNSNRVYFETRDDAVNSGYIPCKICSP